MKFKIGIHIHTSEDPIDWKMIRYSAKDAIDKAFKSSFSALSITLHNKFLSSRELLDYAKSKEILLIPWIEISLNNGFFREMHILILNCNEEVCGVKTIDDLRLYKKKYKDVFIIAAHPWFDFFNSINLKMLSQNYDLFDAIEYSWFYSKKWNRNLNVIKLANALKIPVIATSDAHFIENLDIWYIELDCNRLGINEIFDAIREWKHENITKPVSTKVLLKTAIRMIFRDRIGFLKN